MSLGSRTSHGRVVCGLMCARAVLWQLNKWEVCVTPGTTMHKSSGGAALAGFRKLPKTSDSAQKSGRFVVGVREGSVRGCAGSGIPRVLRPAANRPFRPAVADPRFGVQRRSNSGENGTAKGPIRTRCGPGSLSRARPKRRPGRELGRRGRQKSFASRNARYTPTNSRTQECS